MQPKVRSRDGKPVTFRSVLVPQYVRKSKSLEAALPWLYLKGVSSGEMQDIRGQVSFVEIKLQDWANLIMNFTKLT